MIMKTKLSLISIACLLAVSCSDDISTKGEDGKEKSGRVSNEEMTLTYGRSLLNSNIDLKNTKLTFDRLSGVESINTRSLAAVNDYKTPNLSGATKLEGNNWVEIKDGKVFYIALGETFTGGINFNGNGTLIILGTLGGSSSINVPTNGIVEVAPSGSIAKGSNFHLNSGSVLNNYGSVFYETNSVDGTINNYSDLIFTKQISLNGGSVVNNYCGLTFDASAQFNATLNNQGYINLKSGFHVNGNGSLNLGAGSLTDIAGGSIGVDGKIKNETQGIARIDISPAASIGNINASPAFTGKIDINTSLDAERLKINNQVSLNANTYIAARGCTPERGIRPCDASVLQFTLCATISSPAVGNMLLSATDVRVSNGLAYISYHTNDELYDNTPNGALRIFNIQNQNTPELLSEAIFNKVEFNGVYVDNDKLYAVGGNKDGARLVTTPLTNGLFNTLDLSVFQTTKVPGIAAKTSFFSNNLLWLVSGGTDGGFLKLNPTSSNQFERLYSDGARSKYAAHNNTTLAFFAVEENGAHLQLSNLDGSNPRVFKYNSLVQTVKTGKNALALDDDYAYIALSDRGVAKIELSTGKLVSDFHPNSYRVETGKAKEFKQNGLTNSVAVTDCFLFLANGADGVIVLNKENFNVVGSFKLSESANYVYVKDGLLFVATGRNGLNIIKIN